MSFQPQFLKNASIMMIGTAVAQAIPLAASVFLVRLFTPTQFGIFSAVIAVAVVFAVVATLRYEMAIVLPPDEPSATNLLAVSIGLSVVFLILGLLAGWLMPVIPFYVLGDGAAFWPVALAIGWCIACTQILTYVANRQRAYKQIAKSLIVQQVGAASVAIGVGLAMASSPGLIIGRVVGQASAVVLMLGALRVTITTWLPLVSWKGMKAAAHAFRQFPTFNVPYSVASTISRELLILVFTAMNQNEAAGFYGLARSILTAPVSFLSASLSQVFYKEASVSLETPAFRKFTVGLIIATGLGITPFFVLGWFWAPTIFSTVFGGQWHTAGEYASILMPMAFLSLFTSWPERVFEVRNKQQYPLVIQLTFDFVSVVTVLTLFRSGASVRTVITAYVIVQCFYHMAYLFAVFRVAELESKQYLRSLTFLFFAIVLSTAAQFTIAVFGDGLGAFAAATFAAIGISIVSLAIFWMTQGRAVKTSSF